MQDVVAHVDNIKFDIEIALRQQIGAQPLPFPGMDKAGAAICDFFVRSLCGKGTACPFRHVRGEKSVVCKHWLRGLCKKGDQCEFLHEYDMTKMPECYFYSKFNSCSNKECPFLHIDPESKIKDCPWYDRGFCRHGPNCRHRHTRRICCVNYLNGFCLEGLLCKYMHPRFELPSVDPVAQAKKATIQCHHCGEAGHKIFSCPKLPPEARQQAQYQQQHQQQHQFVRENLHPLQEQNNIRAQRPLEQVTCFKCGEKGHYANRCPKGHLAFLSTALQNQPNQNNEDDLDKYSEYEENWN